jgi:hypothetical protein
MKEESKDKVPREKLKPRFGFGFSLRLDCVTFDSTELGSKAKKNCGGGPLEKEIRVQSRGKRVFGNGCCGT